MQETPSTRPLRVRHEVCRLSNTQLSLTHEANLSTLGLYPRDINALLESLRPPIRTARMVKVNRSSWRLTMHTSGRKSVRRVDQLNLQRKPQSQVEDLHCGLLEQLENAPNALCASDLATLLQTSKMTIYRMANRGVIPSFRVGGLIRFEPLAVAGWFRGKMPRSKIVA